MKGESAGDIGCMADNKEDSLQPVRRQAIPLATNNREADILNLVQSSLDLMDSTPELDA